MSDKIRGLEIQNITLEEAKQRLPEYTYGIVHMFSELQCDTMDKISVNWNELMELRAFSEQGELRVYESGNGMAAQCCTETQEDTLDAIIIKYKMSNGKTLAVKEYLEPDEDGQAVVQYTRPFAVR